METPLTPADRPIDAAEAGYVRVQSEEWVLPPSKRITGPAAAATMAAGLGVFFIGVFTLVAEASTGFSNAMNWWPSVGPLTGKTGLGVILWLVSWLVLYLPLRKRNYSLVLAFAVMIILVAIGLVFTFPPFFQMFAPA